MGPVAKIGTEDHQKQRAQNHRPLGGGDPGHVGEHAQRRQGYDKLHQFFHHRAKGPGHVPAELSPLPGRQNGTAEEQGNHDDLQHIRAGKGAPEVAGKDVHQHGLEALEGDGFILRLPQLPLEVGEPPGVLKEAGEKQADDTGNGSGGQKIGRRPNAHGTHLLQIAHGENPIDHGEQHHRNHQEL